MLFIHYEIDNSKLNTTIDGQPFSPIVEPSAQNMSTLFQDKDADVIVLDIIIRYIYLMIRRNCTLIQALLVLIMVLMPYMAF